MIVFLGIGCAGLVWLVPACVWFRSTRLRLTIHGGHVLASAGLGVALSLRYPEATGLWLAALGPGGLVSLVRLVIGLLPAKH